MKQLSVCIILLLCTSAIAKKSKETYVLVSPNLSKGIIGFNINKEEENEFVDIIAKKVKRILKCNLEIKTAKDAAGYAGATQKHITVFNIADFYCIYRPTGNRQGWLTTQLYVFGPEDNYNKAKYYITVSDTGRAFWGRNNPFEYALKRSLFLMEARFLKVKKNNIGRDVSLTDVLQREKFLDCNNRAYLVEPEFSVATFGYKPGEEEVHDFSRILAYKTGKIIQTETRVITKEELTDLQECESKIIVFDFNVPRESVSISISKSNDQTPLFNKTFNDLNVKDWNENHIFMKGLKILFKNIETSYSTN